MLLRMSALLVVLALLAASQGPSATGASTRSSPDDWPQFLGPARDGKAAAVLELDWATSPPEVLWRLDIGPGFGGAAVRDGEVFLLDREVGEFDVLRVMALATGEPLWDLLYEAPGRLSYPGSRTVPLVTDEYVVTCGGQGRVTCIERASHEEAWSRSLEDDYGGTVPDYGWSCSPLLVGDAVILSALGEEVGLVALDLATGEERWVSPPVGISHSTPVLFELHGERQILFLSTPPGPPSLEAAGIVTISSFDPEDGSRNWEAGTVGTTYPIPTPVQVGPDRLFVTGGYRGGSTLLRVDRKDGAVVLEPLFRVERGAQVHTPILHEDHLYFIANENWNEPRNRRPEGGLVCLGLDGKERWRTGAEPYFGRGNAILAGDHLLIQDGIDGTLRAVRATPEGYQEVGSFRAFDADDRRDHQMWAPMALAGDHLLLRSQDELVCLRL